MKIRTGFVSNSSTSSFCVIGRAIADGEKLDPERRYVAVGRQLENGPEVLDLTAAHIKLLNKDDHMRWAEDNELEVYEVTDGEYDDNSAFISIEEMERIIKDCKARGLEGVTVRHGECDQNVECDDIETFKKIYIEGIDPNEV